VIYFIPRGLAGSKVRATLDFLRNTELVVGERKEIQVRRIITDKDIAKYMSSKIEHSYFKIPRIIDRLFSLISRAIINLL
jgi:hypothetical protein